MKSLGSSAEVMVCVRIKMLCFDSQSMMTRIVSKLEDRGSFSMKSMEMEFQGWCEIRRSGVASEVYSVGDIEA